MAFMKYSLAVLCLALISTHHAAWSQSLRCKGDLVKLGDSKASVLQKCGEPVFKDSFCKPTQVSSSGSRSHHTTIVVPCENVDEWTYNPGSGQFLTNLRFQGGGVAEITYGDRVK